MGVLRYRATGLVEANPVALYQYITRRIGTLIIWLDELVHAEDKVYALSLIRLLDQYFM